MDATALSSLPPPDTLLRGAAVGLSHAAPLLAALPGAVLHRHPALKLAGAWAGYSLALLGHDLAVYLLLGPDALGMPFREGGRGEISGHLLATAFLPLLAYPAVFALLEKRDPAIVDQEEAHVRGLWARVRSWATGKPSSFPTKGNQHVG